MIPTKSKLVCSCPNERSTGDSHHNTNTCEICLGYPGTKPSINIEAIVQAQMIARMLKMRIHKEIVFDRKTYFYPDLPKGYQITQFYRPIGLNGSYTSDQTSYSIKELHLEEDPASISRIASGKKIETVLNYNRSGCPLVEIVTDPVFKSPKDARRFVRNLILDVQDLLKAENISWRADCNISHRGAARIELKNINGYQNIEQAFELEIEQWRRSGLPSVSSTKHFDEQKRCISFARTKEKEGEYLYIPDPNIQRIVLSEKQFQQSVIDLDVCLSQRVKRFQIEPVDPIFARQICVSKHDSLFWNLRKTIETKTLIKIFPLITKRSVETVLLKIERIRRCLEKHQVCGNEFSILEAYITTKNILEESIIENQSTKSTKEYLDEIIAENPDILKDLDSNPRSVNFIIGKIVKMSQGKITINEIRTEIERRRCN